MPSRKRIAIWTLLVFLIAFFGAIILYLAPLLFGETTYDAQGNPTRTVNLFPFGGNTGDNTSPVDPGVDDNSNGENTNNPNTNNNIDRQDQFRLIDEGPVIGAVMFNARGHDGTRGLARATSTDSDIENTFRYIRLGTGHVFEGSTDEDKITRISNTTIPRISEASFVSEDRIIMRYTDDTDRIKTFSAELVRNFADDSGTPFKLQGIFLQDNILDVDISTEGELLQVVSKTEGINRSAVVVTDEIGTSPTQVFSSPVSEWLVSWLGSGPVAILQPRPSYNSFSGAYTLDTSTSAFTPYVDARKAMQVLPTDDLSRALISENAEGATKLYIWNRVENQYIDLGISTFAEKCVWAETRGRFYCAVPVGVIDEAEPDLWYQGVTQYSDQLWEIEPVTGQSQLILLPLQYTDKPLDIVDLLISPDEQFLYMRDKKERSLWSYHIDYDVVGSQNIVVETPSRFQNTNNIVTVPDVSVEVEEVVEPEQTPDEFFEE